MDDQDQITREGRLIGVFAWFVAGYAGIHKVLIPLALHFTNLRGTVYAELQPTILLPVAIAYLLNHPKRQPGILSFLSGMAIVFALYEIYLTASGHYIGWIAFSRLLSSIPLAVICVIFLSQGRAIVAAMAWLGVAALGSMIGLKELTREPLPIPEASVAEVTRSLPPHENILCGAQNLNAKFHSELPAGKLLIRDCGFFPAVIQAGEENLLIENQTVYPVNVHLLISDGVKNRTGWNFLLRPGETRPSPRISLEALSVGVLYSDSLPQVGIAALIPATNPFFWSFTRRPLQIHKVSE